MLENSGDKSTLLEQMTELQNSYEDYRTKCEAVKIGHRESLYLLFERCYRIDTTYKNNIKLRKKVLDDSFFTGNRDDLTT